MIAIKLSVKQLVEALKGLTEKEKEQVKEALEKESNTQTHVKQEIELTERYRNVLNDAELFKQGKLKTYTLSELLDEL